MTLSVAVMSSRRQRLVDPHDPWIAALRAVLRRISADGARLVLGENTAGFEFLRHLALRLNIPIELIPSSPDGNESNLPPQDLAVFAAADVVYALSVRTAGNLHRLLKDSLQKRSTTGVAQNVSEQDSRETSGIGHFPEIVLVDLPHLQSTTARNELCELGVTLWQPEMDDCRPFDPANPVVVSATQTARTDPQDVYLIVPFPDEDGWEYLSHTTRACPGPWPGETVASYVDSLAEARSHADHSPLGALRRILAQRQLTASHRTIRGEFDIVSFTACPLHRLPTLHQFRPHRVHWDFEPYGLCIRRNWLIQRGARPVIYGDDAVWQELSADDRPYFQQARGKTGIDWSIEREWRHQGNVDLNPLTADDVLIFVPDFNAAKAVAEVTNWPVTLWPTDGEITQKLSTAQ